MTITAIEVERIVGRGRLKGAKVISRVTPIHGVYPIFRPAPGKILEKTVRTLEDVLTAIEEGFRTRWETDGHGRTLNPGILTVERSEVRIIR